MIERSAAMPLGVVIEKRRSRSPWQDWIWRPVSVIVGAPSVGAEWRVLVQDDDWVRFHAATLPLELHRTETEPYLVNLSQRPPRVYVVLRPATGPYPFRPLLVTASPFEAESYLESGDEIVEGVPMPEPVVAWLGTFVDRHHVAQPFVKRKRSKVKVSDAPAGGSSWSDRPKRLKVGIGSREDVEDV